LARWFNRQFVVPGLVPGIHDLGAMSKKDVDGRVKPGHDEGRELRYQRGGKCSENPTRANGSIDARLRFKPAQKRE
jgi:hypothetical protein